MHRFLIIALFAAHSVVLARSNQPEPQLKLPPALTRAEAEALEAKEKKEHDDAMARLPPLTDERLKQILKVLREITYPIPFEVLREKLGGPNSLVWCCTRERLGKNVVMQTSTFFVASDTTDYELVVDYDDFPFDKRPSTVIRARFCYVSPLGWRFTAESEDDWLGAGVRR